MVAGTSSALDKNISYWILLRLAKLKCFLVPKGFPDGSEGKESICNAGDPGELGSIPGSGRSPGGGHGNTQQYSYLKSPVDRGTWWATVQRVTESDRTEQLTTYPVTEEFS